MVEPSSTIHYASTNSDKSAIIFATSLGFCIYDTEPFQLRLEERGFGGVKIAEMLDNTSLIALVCSGETPGSSPRNLKLISSHTKDVICDIPFNSTIEALRVSKSKLLVCIENGMMLYELSSMQFLQDFSTIDADLILATKVVVSDNFVVFCTSTVGEIAIFDTLTMKLKNKFSCHKSAVSQVSLNSDSSILATASVTGTIIRVWITDTAQLKFTYRRGTMSTQIRTLSFSPDSQYLLAGSDSSTIHIFKLCGKSKQLEGKNKNNEQNEAATIDVASSSIFSLTPSISQIVSSMSKAVSDVAVTSVSALVEASGISDEIVRATHTVRIPEESEAYIASIINPRDGKNEFKVIVATYEGFIYTYAVNKNEPIELIVEDCEYVSL